MDDGHPHRHSTTARHQLPSGFRRLTARLQRRCLSVASPSGGSETSLWRSLIHTNSRVIVVVASKFICSFDAEGRVHLLLILHRLTSASLFTHSRALSARFVDAPDRRERASAAFRFLQQVDVEAANGELFKPPWWVSRSPSWPISVSK